MLGQFNYWVVILLMMSGFYIVISRGNLIKQVVGLNLFQTSVFILYISLGHVAEATAPIIEASANLLQASSSEGASAEPVYSNPLPQVLILTAIVVNVSTTAVALALVVRIKEAFGSVEEDELESEHSDSSGDADRGAQP